MEKKKIKIEIASDVVCPWCFIGKKRFEAALKALGSEIDAEVTFLPFELNAQIPAEGVNQKKYLSDKFGGEERYEQITNHVTQIAASEGLQFAFDKQKVMPNTFNAHRLIWLGRQEQRQAEIKEALMKAYFEEGKNLASNDVLLEIAEGAGLDRKKILDVLNSDLFTQEVRAAQALNQRRGIQAVPFFVVNGQYGISGAQASSVFVQALREIAAEQPAN